MCRVRSSSVRACEKSVKTPWISVHDPRAVLASGRGSFDTICHRAVPSNTRRHATQQRRRSFMFLFDRALRYSTIPLLEILDPKRVVKTRFMPLELPRDSTYWGFALRTPIQLSVDANCSGLDHKVWISGAIWRRRKYVQTTEASLSCLPSLVDH